MNKTQTSPTIIFIFGGTGDLAHRKLMPALYNLFLDGFLCNQLCIVGIGRSEYTDESYRQYIEEGIKEFSRRNDNPNGNWQSFSPHITYLRLDLSNDKAYQAIADLVKKQNEAWSAEANVVYYMAVAPQLAPTICQKLHAAGLTEDIDKSRMVFEKPFGHNLQSARELDILLGQMFDEKQIYRIDHYLGKETVQNILAFRFANALFEPVWNKHYIDHIQITAAETVSVEGRGSYYEQAGALRDMVQNHILQLLCMIAMEPPVSFEADEIRNKKVDVLNAIRKIDKVQVHNMAVRGQYGAGWMQGEKIKAYREEPNVNPKSPVETFAAIKFFVDNWRWKDVPFYVRTGKCLNEKATLITIQFKPAPHYAFPKAAGETWRPNRLMINIQPEMDIRLRFQAKRTGPSMNLQPVDMVFNYEETEQPEAYETLLLDIIEGDATLFMRADQVEAAWEIITPILEVWQSKPPVDFPNYSPGSWGPEDAQALIAQDGHHWVAPPIEAPLSPPEGGK